MSDSTEFLVKTNKDVEAWMDDFYIDGHKADFRLHCQWAWQEQERRHRAIEADLLEALKLMLMNANGRDLSQDESDALDRAINMAESAIKKATTIQ